MSNPELDNIANRPYYHRDIDFDALARFDPDFAAISLDAKNRRFADFRNPAVVKQLTKSLLKWHFDLKIDLPDDRLCPPVPVRWNYIHWIQQLLDTTNPKFTENYDPSRQVYGLDIGTGASCIYPLLACASRPNWHMVATDIDTHSLTYASTNIATNTLTPRIRLTHSPSPTDPLLPLDKLGMSTLDFTMTNPPFYTSEQDMTSSYTDKSIPPSAVCTGSTNEMICEGGDVGFVSRIIAESLVLRDRVQWYTAMLGKLSSLHQVLAKLKEEGITNFAVTQLQAGYRTKRWGVAWSFGGWRARNDVSRRGDLVVGVIPAATANTIVVEGVEGVVGSVNAFMEELEVEWRWKEERMMGLMLAKGNVWSRAARRRRQFRKDSEEESSDDEMAPAFVVMISCQPGKVEVRWVKGSDALLFQSFCKVLKNTLVS